MKIAVLVPCLNEEITVAKVVRDFKKELPKADIYVYDNGSTDNTKENALKAGAIVRECRRKGKGNALKKMFSEIEADYYIMVDGDDTYDAGCVKKLLKPVVEGKADMAIGTRLKNFQKEEKSFLHAVGNRIILWQLKFCFPCRITDLLSGYRVMTRDVVKELNLLSSGFTIETEMTIKTLEAGFKIKEIPCPYKKRPRGSKSKLSTFGDGYGILSMILSMFRDYRPMQFFMFFSILTFSVAAGFGVRVVMELIYKGSVHRYGSLILSTFFLTLTFLLIMIGFLGSSIHAAKMEILNKK